MFHTASTITWIPPVDADKGIERRVRRSSEPAEALAFQCAHVQSELDLEALVVADDTGDRWVGAGDKALCRILSNSVSDFAFGTNDQIGARIDAIQIRMPELEASDVTTYTMRIPGSGRFLHVAGVGSVSDRAGGVRRAAAGSRRILGLDPRARRPDVDPLDAIAVLRAALVERWMAMRFSGSLEGQAPRGRWGLTDDGQYGLVLDVILEPVLEILHSSGVRAELPWGGWRWGGKEFALTDGWYLRTLKLTLREQRSGARLGWLEVAFLHRHDRWEIGEPPHIELSWR